MSVPYTQISILSASHVARSYSAQRGCISSVNARSSSVGPTHVPRLYWLPKSCISSSKTFI